MAAYFFTAWLISIPFIVRNGAYEGPKVIVFLIGGFLLTLFWVVKSLKEFSGIKLNKKDLWFLGWLLILTVSSLLGVHAKDSMLGASYRHQGVIFFLTLWLIGKTVEILSPAKKAILYKGIATAVVLEGLIVIYQVTTGKLYLGKPLGTIGEANAVAGFLAIGSYFVFTSFPKISLIVPAVSIFLTQSRAGIIAFIANLGYLIDILGKKSRLLLFGLGALFTVAVVVYFTQGKGVSVFENREVIWPLAIKQIIREPVLGYGAESGEVVFNQAYREFKFPLTDLIVDRAHNLALDLAMWSGIFGLAAFGGWVYYSYKDIKEISKKFALGSFLIYSMLQPLSVVHWTLLFLII